MCVQRFRYRNIEFSKRFATIGRVKAVAKDIGIERRGEGEHTRYAENVRTAEDFRTLQKRFRLFRRDFINQTLKKILQYHRMAAVKIIQKGASITTGIKRRRSRRIYICCWANIMHCYVFESYKVYVASNTTNQITFICFYRKETNSYKTSIG